MKSEHLRVGLCQSDISWENRDKTRELLGAMLADVDEKLDWLVFPEMTLSGFSQNRQASTLMDIDHMFFKDEAIRREAYVTYGGISSSGHNKMWTVSPTGDLVCEYNKRHLFALAGERDIYVTGTNAPQVFSVCGWRVAPTICYDLRFTYQFWPLAQDVDIFVNIANWPASRDRHWRTLLQARAIENQAFMVGVNRCGRDPHLPYCGSSLAVNPMGEVVCDAGDGPGVRVAQLDLLLVRATRERFPFLRDRLEPDL